MVRGAVRLGHEDFDAFPDELAPGVTEHRFGQMIRGNHPPLRVDDDDRVRSGFEKCFEIRVEIAGSYVAVRSLQWVLS